MNHQSAFIRRADGKVVIADVVEKAKVDQLVARLREANVIEGREQSQAAITRIVDEFEGVK